MFSMFSNVRSIYFSKVFNIVELYIHFHIPFVRSEENSIPVPFLPAPFEVHYYKHNHYEII